MIEKIDDGGPAFARSSQGPSGHLDWNEGMSLRDWFAGMALQGNCSDFTTSIKYPRDIAEHAYRLADAMLEARKK